MTVDSLRQTFLRDVVFDHTIFVKKKRTIQNIMPKRTRSATHRNSFQSHIIVFFSEKNFLFENHVFSTYYTYFFQKLRKQSRTTKIVCADINVKNRSLKSI
jgi:hypothetical protein